MISDNLIFGFHGRFRFLSNFFPVKHGVYFEGHRYPTSEHAYQAGKTVLPLERALIMDAKSPGEAKRLGSEVRLRPKWEDLKLIHMEGCLRGKFKAGTLLAEMLINTGDAKIVEANTWGDTFWGRCRGTGKNHLGCLLMDIREDLQNEYGTGTLPNE
jgi:ribA/ribD-fused uncharacterized protein